MRLDRNEVLDRIFNDSDYSEDSDFTDSENDILEEVFGEVNLVREIVMTHSERDRDSPIDEEGGWGKMNSDTLMMPFG